jgi:protein-disulfide isomerase
LAASNTASVTINVGSEANTFTVADDIGSGTLIGAVTAPDSLSETRVFEIVDSDTVDALKLLPDDHISGDPAAPLVLIEYLDLQCPTCQTFHPIVEDLEAEFDDELLVVRRHLPLTSIHENAFAAAQSAEAAARQGAFKEMADLMFENQRDWEFVTDPQPFFDSYASDIGLDLVQFTVDRQDPEIDARIQRDIDVANSLGAAGTPTFYLNGRSLDLNDALDDFEELIDDELDDFDAPFVVNRLSGELFLAPDAVLNADSNPMRTLTVNVTDDNGVTFSVPVTVNVTDASAPQAAASAAAIDKALADWN